MSIKTTTEAPVVLAGRTFAVQALAMTYRDRRGQVRSTVDTHLIGPNGAEYFLRGYLGEDTGARQVISFRSGAPLRIKGNEVRVTIFGDVIEEVPARR